MIGEDTMIDNIEKQISDVEMLFDKGIIKNRLSQIKIHSFRKFAEESELNFTFPITVIVGKNGSGKTTVMKAIKLLSRKQIPQDEFFETVIDDGGFQNADISYTLDDQILHYKRIRQNEWGKEGEIPEKFAITYIQTKTMVGAIDKSFLYDNIGKNTARTQKVEYVIKQSRKIKQNPRSNSERKQRHFLSSNAIEIVNYILQGNVNSIEVIRHKYYSGTWGTSVIFNDGNQYSEYNAGSGEFVIASMVDQIQGVPSESVLLLDEPEVSLHPGAQKRLICYILEVIKKKKLQVIITTHSTTIVEKLPKTAIKCFRRIENDIIIIEEQVLFQNAFLELESDIIDKKHIIVEDDLAKRIIEQILKAEGLSKLLQVEFYPGGASNIKKYTILTYSKTKVDNRYIIFDGDQKKDEIPDLSRIPEADKTEKYLKDIFKKVIGISADKIDWGVDANRKAGRVNADQEKELLLLYLEYFRNRVSFLPQVIPEDIIYNESRLKIMLGEDGFPDVSQEKDSKKKLKVISDVMGQEIGALEYQLIYWFVKQKNSDYQCILEMLKSIIEG